MKNDPAAAVRAHLESLADLAGRAAADLPRDAARYADLVRSTLDRGGRLFFAGNGGSAAAAEHIATEYVVRFRRERAALPAIALTSGVATLTATANDFGFESVFARALRAYAAPGDLLVLHSTSGRSPNLVEAARVAAEIPVSTVALLDRDGGELASLVDVAIHVPATDPASVQELQLAIEHAVVGIVDEWIADREVADRDGR